MVNLFGVGKPKCVKCGMELQPEQTYEWQDKKFCSKGCKHSYMIGNKGGCH